jgi:hypothetical protein
MRLVSLAVTLSLAIAPWSGRALAANKEPPPPVKMRRVLCADSSWHHQDNGKVLILSADGAVEWE